MSTASRASPREFEAARRRALEDLRTSSGATEASGRIALLFAAGALFAAIFGVRLAVRDPGALIANFYVVPIALVAVAYGMRSGLGAAAVAFALVLAWSALESVHVTALGYSSRAAVFLVTGAVVGGYAERLREDIAARRRAQRRLALYADELERANLDLARTVTRLEAFAEIARAAGGETELQRVLGLILAHGREIVAARRLLVCLLEDGELVTLSTDGAAATPRMPVAGTLAGEVLASRRPRRVERAGDPERLARLDPGARAAIVVPLVFRGEPLGVLAGIDRTDGRPFAEEDEQLLEAIAASAASAVSTARSVAAARLRASLEAAEQARARWARELHDETLQGLIGIRMVLAAGLARDDPALRSAARNADAHLGEEMRRLRALIAELRPAALDDLGLGAAIDSLAKRQASIGGFELSAEIALDEARRLPRDTEGAVYRIVQEALSNVIRHAGARRVTVAVRQLAAEVEIEVGDDGRGFHPEPTAGFGLAGMRERAVLAGGSLSVSSADGGPTHVRARLPVT